MKPLLAVACLMLLCSAASAQDSDGKKYDVFVGYTFTSTDLLETPEVVPGSRSRLNGGTVEFTWNANPHVGITGQFSGNTGSQRLFSSSDANARLFTFMGGPKISQRAGQFNLYMHTLFGVAHATISSPFLETSSNSVSSTDFGMAIGGGLDWVGSGHFSYRIVQAEYMMSQVFSSHTSYDRVSTGIVFRW